MFPIASDAAREFFVFPDVCKTPAPPAPFIPVPYPESAPPLGAKAGRKTKVPGKGPATKRSGLSRSRGDEAGALKGLASTTRGRALVRHLQTKGFSFAGATLMVEGKPVASGADQKVLHTLLSSNANAPAGAQVSPTQTRVLVAP